MGAEVTTDKPDIEIDEIKRIHAPVVQVMERMGYGLLLDGKTFYKIGYELAPRKHTTFTLTQAYEIHRLLIEAENRGGVRELRRKMTLNLNDMSSPDFKAGFYEAANQIDKACSKRIKQLTTKQEGEATR